MKSAGTSTLRTVAVLLLAAAFSLVTSLGSKARDAGSDLKGWRTVGPIDWRSEGSQFVGSARQAKSGNGWLIQDQRHEDVRLSLSFECNDSDAGVLLRGTEIEHRLQGIYVPICGAGVGTVLRLGINPDGTKVEPSTIATFRNQDPPDPAQFPFNKGGWNHVDFFLRGQMLVVSFNGYRAQPCDLVKAGAASAIGLSKVGIGVAANQGASIRLKDLETEDLLVRNTAADIVGKGFREKKVTDLFYSEGVAVGDLNRDGNLDLVTGPFYYLGPDFKTAVEIYPSSTFNPNTPPYTDSFLNYVYDFNGDGWPDVLKVNFDGAFLYVNPRGENRHWDVYKVVDGIAAETTQFADVDGDGRPELILSQKPPTAGKDDYDNVTIEYAKPNWADPTKPWAIHRVSEVGNWGGHALGVGDLNGDGRVDIVQASGWWEQPPPGENGVWKFHAAPFRGDGWTEMQGPWAGGADMFVYDVNGDGLPDVITSLAAHGWGLAWFEQVRDSNGSISWKQHMIMGNPSAPDRAEWEETDKTVAFSELHALALADMDGDGLKDIVVGKRWWSHGDNYSGPDAQTAAVLYWFQLVRKPGGAVQWIPHLISNHSGIGTQIVAVDLNGDGKPDVITTARKGTFVYLNCDDCN